MTSAGFPLHRPELFDALVRGEAALDAVMRAPAVFRRGEALTRAGEASQTVYRIESGWAARCRDLPSGRRQIILVFLPGDVVGIKALLLEKQPDSIECLTDVSARTVDQAVLRALVESNAAVAWRLLFQLGEDERRLHNWIAARGRGDAEERIATFLLDLRGRLHRRGLGQGDAFRLPMTQQQIGDHLGLTVVHVNRVLRRLREAGIVTVRAGSVTIDKPDLLGERAAALQDLFERENREFSGGPLPTRA
jgi:CRP/FNR family transcriptional regulator, anaerobic regulatory protein